MLKVEDYTIYLVRGDSAYLQVIVYNQNGTQYIVKDDDELVFSMKKKITDNNYSLQKQCDINGYMYLEPEDTEVLEPGRYVYDVQLTLSTGEVFTIIPVSYFYLLEGVTE